MAMANSRVLPLKDVKPPGRKEMIIQECLFLRRTLKQINGVRIAGRLEPLNDIPAGVPRDADSANHPLVIAWKPFVFSRDPLGLGVITIASQFVEVVKGALGTEIYRRRPNGHADICLTKTLRIFTVEFDRGKFPKYIRS